MATGNSISEKGERAPRFNTNTNYDDLRRLEVPFPDGNRDVLRHGAHEAGGLSEIRRLSQRRADSQYTLDIAVLGPGK